MPAPAVIPAPIAYIKVVAVKKLVVGFWEFMDVGWSFWKGLVSIRSLLDFICSMSSGFKLGSGQPFLNSIGMRTGLLGVFFDFKCALFSGSFFWVSPFLLLSKWK